MIKTHLRWLALLTLVLVVIYYSLVGSISPKDTTNTAMLVTLRRIHGYMKIHRNFPADLSVLPEEDGSFFGATDGWGRALIYSVDDRGVITLSSLGRDAKVGGDGEDEDIVRRHRTRNADGSLNIDDDMWIVDSEIRDDEQ